jgi:beta-glucanase (GH16 family)
MEAAPGAGIVSSLVLQSDDLDEIDMEWLGADDAHVQTNYFGKGDTSTYDRGQFNPAANNQEQFITYTVEWTAEQVIWSVGGSVVRVLTPATADTNQYPQTPMQIKFGSWSGGDPSNPPGTIQWARGPTDYSKGPFTMTVQSIAISDYSTGTSYEYSGRSGNWQDITAVGGAVNGNIGSAASTVAVVQSPSATSASPSIPFGGSDSTKTGWPWVASSTTLSTAVATSSVAGIPSGWTVSGSGKIVPVSTAAVSKPPPGHFPPAPSLPYILTPKQQTSYPTSYSSPAPSPSPSSPPSSAVAGLEIITTWDSRGFLTTMTVPAGCETTQKCWNEQGFQVACGVTSAPTAPPTTTAATSNKEASQVVGAITASTISSAPHDNSATGTKLAMPIWYVAGFVAVATLL